jgi:hypothetical protein
MLAIYIINKNVEIYAGGGEDMIERLIISYWTISNNSHIAVIGSSWSSYNRNRKIARDDDHR